MLKRLFPYRVALSLSIVALFHASTAAQVIDDPIPFDPMRSEILFAGESPMFTSFHIGDERVESTPATLATFIALPETTRSVETKEVTGGVESCTTDSCTATDYESGEALSGGCSGCADLFCKSADFDDPCAKSHGKLHYWNDFSYLDDPDYSGHCCGDGLKRLGKNCGLGCLFGSCGNENASESWLDVGGRFRLRYHNERGLGRQVGSTLLDANQTNHGLSQIRLFGDWHINNHTRVFAEGLYADLAGSSDGYRPRVNERNRGDILNLFIDMKISDSTTVRFGRQQLMYGSRRLIAGPGWANTSRSHDGIKVIQKFGKLRIDYLYMARVPISVDDFDEPDYERALFGTWATYKGSRDRFDAYYLGFDDDRPGREKIIHTIGAQLSGGERWLYDIEGAGQFGRQTAMGLDHAAAFATVGVGRKLAALPWSPTLWAYYDFATGDAGGGAFNAFDRIFNRAHHYLGFIDLAHRSNVEIPSLELTLNPTKRFKILSRYYHIMANQETGVIDSLGGLTAAQNLTSKDYGDTVDIAAYYKLTPRSNARVGYSHFWRGNKIIADHDASFTYAEWAVWF